MAQGTVVAVMAARGGAEARGGGNASLVTSLKPDELHELLEYEKLLQFRDEVASGLHPRFKPAQLPEKAAQGPGLPRPSNPPKSQPAAPKAPLNGDRPVVDNFKAYESNSRRPPVTMAMATNLPGLGALPASSSSDPSRPFGSGSGSGSGAGAGSGSGKLEINPVLLEKSDDLIKAEMQLHRQRVERGLREQIEQRRASQKALQASEQLADFDIAEVLAAATALVAQETSAQPTDDTAANASASGDSFDDNTFYSSQLDTPQSHQVSRIHNESDDEQMRDASPYEPELETEPVVRIDQPQLARPAVPPAQNILATAILQKQPAPSTSSPATGISQTGIASAPAGSSEGTSVGRAFRQLLSHEVNSSQGSGPASRSEESVNTGKGQPADHRDLARVNAQLLSQALRREESPVVRAHDLSPVAPQPNHISPLAFTRQQPLAQLNTGSHTSSRRATPAQVAALRKQLSAASSPESSPQGNGARKKGKKKKKRKADRLAETSAPSPTIKPEPRSPSPLTAPPFIRPAKRQRQSLPQHQGLDEARFEQPIIVEDGYTERYLPGVRRQERVLYQEREGEPRRHDVDTVIVPYPRYERVERVVYPDNTRQPASARPIQPGSPSTHPPSYLPREVRTVRSVSHLVEAPFEESPTYYRDPRAASRTSVHPATAYRERSQSPVMYERTNPNMPPPPTRILVDAYGNEYLQPPRQQTIVREVSEYRPAEADLMYGRPSLPRAVSRRPDMYEENGVVYRPASPTYAAPRRIVTQPEFPAAEHRSYRERAYSSHSMAPPIGEYMQPPRSAVEPPREYISRPTSVRPPIEAPRYESAAPYESRRPVEERPREFLGIRAGSVRPTEGVRYEMPVAYERRVGDELVREYTSQRAASVMPPEAAIRYEVSRDYGARVGSARPEMSYSIAAHPDGRREMMQAPPPAGAGRAYSVMPGEAPQPQQQQQQQQGVERYYGRPPQAPVQDDEEVIFLDRPGREMYR
ncbi:hypothetical protein B0T22DRAFT_458753 [Podospora appendiculata]|uniref:Uncharacterized protein n=1 Tax=Podospora appendiculata TaxID=314037 RepID=A0AAE0X8N9_9PEZI|nr:hypothetical protein B0T22DRAFT_458753 [Podospora appendiculata]